MGEACSFGVVVLRIRMVIGTSGQGGEERGVGSVRTEAFEGSGLGEMEVAGEVGRATVESESLNFGSCSNPKSNLSIIFRPSESTK